MAVTKGQGNPDWTRDETILALNVLFQLNGKNPSPKDKKVIELSKTLNHLPIHPLELRKENFRNPDGVSFKIGNLLSVKTGRGLKNSSKMDKSVWNEYGNKPDLVSKLANVIISSCGNYFNENEELNSVVRDDETFAEGKIITEIHNRKERDEKLRPKIIEIRKRDGKLFCDICGIRPYFDDSIDECAFYECHHIVPLSQIDGDTKTKVNDIAFLCANCHRAIHRKMAVEKRPVTIEEMKRMKK